MNPTLPIDQRIVVDAAEWLVKLHSHEMTAADHVAFERWRAQSKEHQRAWAAANTLARTLSTVPPALGKLTLNRPRNRRTVVKTLALVIAAAPIGWITWQKATRERYQTAAGEWQTHTLADGSTIRLNSGATIDIAFSDTQRLIHLGEGEVLIETAKDHVAPARPFLIQTKNGTARALGTRFIVRQWEKDTQVSVLEHAVEIQTNDRQRLVLAAGEYARFDSQTISESKPLDVATTAWTQGMLIADGQRLHDFVKELSRYRPGILHCDPAVADLKISGVFQLSDTDKALNILQDTLPITVLQRTRYWVTIAATEGKSKAGITR